MVFTHHSHLTREVVLIYSILLPIFLALLDIRMDLLWLCVIDNITIMTQHVEKTSCAVPDDAKCNLSVDALFTSEATYG